MSWTANAIEVIAQAIAQGRKLSETNEQIRRRVDAAYPFGAREYWPYKAWLKERRRLFCLHNIITSRNRPKPVDGILADGPVIGSGGRP